MKKELEVQRKTGTEAYWEKAFLICMKRHNYYLDPSDMKQSFRHLITGLNVLDQIEQIQITEIMLDTALLDVILSLPKISDHVKNVVSSLFSSLQFPVHGPTKDVWNTQFEYTEIRKREPNYIQLIIEKLDPSEIYKIT